MYRFRRPLVALGAILTALVLASSALAAFQSLPAAGGQVNDDNDRKEVDGAARG